MTHRAYFAYAPDEMLQLAPKLDLSNVRWVGDAHSSRTQAATTPATTAARSAAAE
jgi:hypothetical protein